MGILRYKEDRPLTTFEVEKHDRHLMGSTVFDIS